MIFRLLPLLLALAEVSPQENVTNLTIALGVAQDVYSITYKLRTVVFTAERAVEEINLDASLLPHHRLRLSHKETACSEAAGFQAVVDAHAEGSVGFLGATCSSTCQTVATVGKIYHVPQVSHSCTSDALSDSDRYPYFNRVVGKDSQQVSALVNVAKYFNWTTIGLLHDTQSYGNGIKAELLRVAPQAGITVSATAAADPPQDGSTEFGEDLTLALNIIQRGGSRILIVAFAQSPEVIVNYHLLPAGLVGPAYQILGTESLWLFRQQLLTTAGDGAIMVGLSQGDISPMRSVIESEYPAW